jgi:xanthine/uracil permease
MAATMFPATVLVAGSMAIVLGFFVKLVALVNALPVAV